jgi:dihydropyrimidinase
MKLARKLGGGDVVSAALGYPAIATYLPTVITEGYRQRGIPLSRIVDLTSTNAARIFGLYPAKGTLRVGSDADLVAVDLEAARPVKAALLPGWSDFALNEGKTLTGWPALTMVRGTPVWQDGRIQTSRGYGKYVSRNRESTVTR